MEKRERVKNSTFIALYREMLYSSVFDDPITLKVWIWCLLKASYKERTIEIGTQQIKIFPGQFVIGRKSASSQLKLSEMQYRSRIKTLERTQRITVKVTNRFSIITVINWALYQITPEEITSKLTNKQPTDNQQTTTNNNVENDKELLAEQSSGPSSEGQSVIEKDMSWNRNSDNDDDLPIIEDGEVQETNEERIKKENAKVRSLMEWGEKVRGKKFIDVPTQLKHIKLLKAQGIIPSTIKETYLELLQSDYWKNSDRLPDFKTVVSILKNKK